jgi:capsular polysaccharide biosynthesis protein
MAHPESIRLLRKLTAKISSERSSIQRVYISRADTKLRRIENEDEIIQISQRHGFHVARLAELPLAEQLALIRGARYIAGPHGMGMTHFMFNQGPLSILELFHPTLGTDAYAMMARAMDFSYSALVGEDSHDGRGSYRIDPEQYEQKLREMA